MYTNVGNKIKILSQILGWICFAAGFIAWLILLSDDEPEIAWISLGSGILGFLSSWFTYGFGQLVDDVQEIRDKSLATHIPTQGIKQTTTTITTPNIQRTATTWVCGACQTENSNNYAQCKKCGKFRG